MMTENWICAGKMEDLQKDGPLVIKGGIVVFYHEDTVYAVDNRCPHMGFPLQMGSVCDGILTCHWHHARFDICSGGTLDPWADNVPSHEVLIDQGEIWVNPHSKQTSDMAKYKNRLQEGLEQNIGIVIAKAIVGLMESGANESDIAKMGIEFGTTYGRGWNSGLTILVAMTRILPKLNKQGKILALYQGLSHVARNSSNSGQRHLLDALPTSTVSFERLTEWYRNCIEVRDTQGAEKVLLTVVQSGASVEQLAEMMIMAVTDHYFLDGGHTLDFHNKAFEALQFVGEEQKSRVLTSLIHMLANPTRSEELHQWQAPIDLVGPTKSTFAVLRQMTTSNTTQLTTEEEQQLLHQLLSDQPLETIRLLMEMLQKGVDSAQVAQLVALAAAERIVRFHTQNDFGDWITVLHTFTYTHAVHERMRHSAQPLLYRAIFHGAISVYLDRFLNVPAASRPKEVRQVNIDQPEQLLEILELRQQVNEAANWVVGYLRSNGNRQTLFNILGHSLLREDANFHSFQMYEAAMIENDYWAERNDPFALEAQESMLLATARYLAAHAPTARENSHTTQIAWRLHRGERLFEEK